MNNLKKIPVGDVDQFCVLTEEAFVKPWGSPNKLHAINALYHLRHEIAALYGKKALRAVEKFAAKEVGTYRHMFKSL